MTQVIPDRVWAKLSEPQKRYLREIYADGQRRYNGRARKPLTVLHEHGLIEWHFDLRSAGREGRYTELFIVQAVPGLTLPAPAKVGNDPARVAPGHWTLLGHDIVRHGSPTRPRYWRILFKDVELAKTASKDEAIRWIRKHRREVS